MKHKLLIFDWDGTLADSAQHIVGSVKSACVATNTVFPGETSAKNIIGLGMREALTELFGARDERFVQAFREAYAQHFFSIPPSRDDLFQGVPEMLQQFRSLGYRLAIATGKSRHGMELALKAMGLEDWFDGVRCADETSSKPDPKMLLELLEMFGLNPDQAIMIGDTVYDMDMAKRLFMPRIAVTYGVHEIERLQIFEPGGVADKPSQLVDVVCQLAR